MSIQINEPVLPAVGDYLILDGKRIGEKLMPGDNFSDSGYPGCQFRYPVDPRGPIKSVAINIVVTGRTFQFSDGARWVRVRVEFVGDCEPSTFRGGRLIVA